MQKLCAMTPHKDAQQDFCGKRATTKQNIKMIWQEQFSKLSIPELGYSIGF